MRPLSIVLLAALSAATSAQVQPLAYSRGVSLQVGTAPPAAIAPGNDLTGGAFLTCAGPSGDARFVALHTVSTQAVDLDWTVSCRAFAAGAVSGTAAARCELWAAQPVVGQLVVSWTPTLTGTGSAACAIDLQDDGTVDATSTVTMAVAFGPGPLPLRLQVAGSAHAGVFLGPFGARFPYQGTANASLHLRLEPTHCQITAVGPGCGEQLTAIGNLLGGADLLGSFTAGNDLAIAVLGFDHNSCSLPLPPGCSLHTTPAAVLCRGIDLAGRANWSFAAAAAVPRPFAFTAQLVGFDSAALRATASAAVAITCR